MSAEGELLVRFNDLQRWLAFIAKNSHNNYHYGKNDGPAFWAEAALSGKTIEEFKKQAGYIEDSYYGV